MVSRQILCCWMVFCFVDSNSTSVTVACVWKSSRSYLVSSSYFWPTMHKEVAQFVARFLVYQLAKGTSTNVGLYLPLPIPTQPWSLLIGSLKWRNLFLVSAPQMFSMLPSFSFERFIACTACLLQLSLIMILDLSVIFGGAYGDQLILPSTSVVLTIHKLMVKRKCLIAH